MQRGFVIKIKYVSQNAKLSVSKQKKNENNKIIISPKLCIVGSGTKGSRFDFR